MGEQSFRRIDVKTESYVCGDEYWKINLDAHKEPAITQIKDLLDQFDKVMDDLKTMVVKEIPIEGSDKTTKKLVTKITAKEAESQLLEINRSFLKIAFLPTGPGNPKGFDYDKAQEKFGPKTVDGVVVDMKSFLVDIGGMDEYNLLRQRLEKAKQSGLSGMMD